MLKFALRQIIAKSFKSSIFSKTITEDDLQPLLKEIRTALINSDVSLEVIKGFIDEIKAELIENKKYALNQQDIEISVFNAIKDKLIKILTSKSTALNIKENTCSKYLFVGMNGSGKTTTIGKVANLLKKHQGKKIKTICLDQTRPAAYDQLHKLCSSIGVECYRPEGQKLSEFINTKIKESYEDKTDVLIFDTAGLIPNDDEELENLTQIKKWVDPLEVIYVLDAMAGQDAIEIVRHYHEVLNITSLIVSKSDSDAPMGAAFSMVYMLKIPIKFLGTGEHINELKPFYVDRIAGQILGEGDIISMAEKLQETVDEDLATNSIKRMMSGKFDLLDLVQQVKQLKKMGPLSSLIKNMPMFAQHNINADHIESELMKWEVLINSMTKQERKHPKLFKKEPNRKVRVVKGSGRKMDDLNKLIKKWEEGKKKMEVLLRQKGRGMFDISKLMGG